MHLLNLDESSIGFNKNFNNAMPKFTRKKRKTSGLQINKTFKPDRPAIGPNPNTEMNCWNIIDAIFLILRLSQALL